MNVNRKMNRTGAETPKAMTTTGPRTLVVLDTENLVISCRKERDEPVDFKAIDRWLHSNYHTLDKVAFINIDRLNGNRRILDFLGWTFRDVVTKFKDEDTGAQVRIKNAIDIELALSTYEFIMENYVEQVVLISGDGDFLPLVKRILKRGIAVDVMAIKASTSRKLAKFADCYWSYEDVLHYRDAVEEVHDEPCIPTEAELAFEAGREESEEEQSLDDVFRACTEVLDELLAVEDPVNASRFKTALLKKDPDFSERKLGFARFRDFLIEGAAMDLFDMSYGNGGIWVTAPSVTDEEYVPVLAGAM